jgi:hypothetical protein
MVYHQNGWLFVLLLLIPLSCYGVRQQKEKSIETFVEGYQYKGTNPDIKSKEALRELYNTIYGSSQQPFFER